jgi:hypothetical protein
MTPSPFLDALAQAYPEFEGKDLLWQEALSN